MSRWGFVLAFAIAGCSDATSFDDICERIDDNCVERDDYAFSNTDCHDNGRALEDQVLARPDCASAYDAYLACLDGAGCDWPDSCVLAHTVLFQCLEQ